MGQEWDKDKGGRDEWIAWLGYVMFEAYLRGTVTMPVQRGKNLQRAAVVDGDDYDW